MPAPAKSRSGFLRRYPALGLMVAAAALAILLPSALTVPQSGPSTLAEFAPVPGAGDGRSDISDLGSAQSGGLGFGSGSGGKGELPPQQIGAPTQKTSRLKRCVGSPPRQTEDLLSPPCVAFFEGDNFGATARGVTRDEVTVIAEVGVNQTTDPNNYQKIIDCGTTIKNDEHLNVIACKSYMKFFNDRYQTYGRSVHLWVSFDAPVAEADSTRKPFGYTGAHAAGAASRKIVGITHAGSPRKQYTSTAPYYFSYRADLEDQARLNASYICQKLNGRVAKHAGVRLQAMSRKFGLLHEIPNERDILKAELKAQCGIVPQQVDAGAGASITTGMATFSGDNVTTIITVLAQPNQAVATNAAAQNAYFPEWFVAGANQGTLDTNAQGRLANPAEWANAFGITFDYRRDAVADQMWFRAYRDGCADCPAPGSGGGTDAPKVYDTINMFFYGLQASGPRLTAENIDKGLHAIPAASSTSPYRPATYFAPGNYSFLKDAMMIWWDPAGTPPGSSTAGCYKLPLEGRRFRSVDWVDGDGDVKGLGPCQGDTFQ